MKSHERRLVHSGRGTMVGLAILSTICFAPSSSFADASFVTPVSFADTLPASVFMGTLLASTASDPIVPLGSDGLVFTLGSAADFAVLGIGSSVFGVHAGATNNSNIHINGNQGIGFGGSISNMAPSTVTGNVIEYSSGQLSGPGHVNGSVIVDPTAMNDAYDDALSASQIAAGLDSTQSFTLTNSPLTIDSTGLVNVIDLTGNITNTIDLEGPASAFFIVNVTGTLTLNGSTMLALSDGLTADHVLYNFTSSGLDMTSHVGNVMNGTLLAINDSYSNFDGTLNGEIISSKAINLLSASTVNQVSFAGFDTEVIPEPDTLAMTLIGAGMTGLAGLLRRKKGARR